MFTDDVFIVNRNGKASDFVSPHPLTDEESETISTYLPDISDGGEIDQVALASQIKQLLLNLSTKRAEELKLNPLDYSEIIKVVKSSFVRFIHKNLPSNDAGAVVIRQLLTQLLTDAKSPITPFLTTLFE